MAYTLQVQSESCSTAGVRDGRTPPVQGTRLGGGGGVVVFIPPGEPRLGEERSVLSGT